MKIYQCRLQSDDGWWTIGWVLEARAKVGTVMNVIQRLSNGKIRTKKFTVKIVHEPPQEEDEKRS